MLHLGPLALQWAQVAARALAGARIEEALWSEWFLFRQPRAREALVGRYRDFARMLAAQSFARRMDRGLEFGDYLHFALLGLIDSIDRFDTVRGVPFEAYAATRIRGAILDGVNLLSEQQAQAAAHRRRVAARTASLQEGADGLDLDTLDGLAEAAIGLALGFMLEDTALFRPGGEEPRVFDSAYRSNVLRQTVQAVHAALARLDERSRTIMEMHYLQERSLSDIADHLKFTRGRISQLHRAALQKLALLIDPAHAGVDQHY